MYIIVEYSNVQKLSHQPADRVMLGITALQKLPQVSVLSKVQVLGKLQVLSTVHYSQYPVENSTQHSTVSTVQPVLSRVQYRPVEYF